MEGIAAKFTEAGSHAGLNLSSSLNLESEFCCCLNLESKFCFSLNLESEFGSGV